jgi:endoglucanase
VNWFGFDEGEFVAGGLDRAPLEEIAATIHRLGFNTVRLPYANQVVEDNPLVPDYAVAANPQFKGKHAMEIMDAVIAALARQHVMIVLDDHVSRADWCCAEKDGNGLWYNRDYPETSWIADWQGLVRRYAGERWVIGADLRNELRSGAVWGGNDSAVDWHAAAERGGNAVLAMNPHLLIMVEGVSYSTDLSRVGALPVKLAVPHQLVYSPHEYGFHRPSDASYEALHERLDKR